MVELLEAELTYDHKAMPATTGDEIRTERARLGWSQRTLARHAGITAGYVALIEKGTRSPGEDLLARLHRIFAGEGTAASALSFGDAQTPVFAGVLAGLSDVEVSLPLPDDVDWFDRVPFTTVVGPLGSGKTTFVARWLSEAAQRTGRHVVWVQLTPTVTVDDIEKQVVMQTVSKDDTAPGDRGRGGLLAWLARQIEGNRKQAPILCFDDWDARIGGAHAVVSELAAQLERTPVIATTESARPSGGGSTVCSVPRPTADDWHGWCEQWHVPEPVREDLVGRVDGNLLAAAMVRGAVYFGAGGPSAHVLDGSWRDVVSALPMKGSFSWPSLLSECVQRVSEPAVRVLRMAALSPEPLPKAWLGEDGASADASRLLSARLARFVRWQGEPRVVVHPVLRQHNWPRGLSFPSLVGMTPEPVLVDLLLNMDMYDEAAGAMSSLIDDWSTTSEAPGRVIQWADRLTAQVLDAHPKVRLGLARALALRARSGDLDRAASVIQAVSGDPRLSDGQRWQAELQTADVAIRRLDYETAMIAVERAARLHADSAGSFDEGALGVLRARIYWEQSRFTQAREAMVATPVGGVGVEAARRTSWVARASASLGDFSTAVRESTKGLELCRRSGLLRAEAYSAVLLAEYELVRGNLARARRLAQRGAEIADVRGLPNLRAQALAAEAETACAMGEPKEADKLLRLANEAVTQRGDDPWTNAYMLVAHARLSRWQPKWTLLWSLAQQLELEANALRHRAPLHPVIGALLIESAHCWMASGYTHEARRVIGSLRPDVEWRTRLEAALLDVVSAQDTPIRERSNRTWDLVESVRAAGAPYLATSCAYVAATYSVAAGDESMTTAFGTWAADAAEARGWPILAAKARALAPRYVGAAEHGVVVTQPDGSATLVAPRRPQQGARRDPDAPLPDPFDE